MEPVRGPDDDGVVVAVEVEVPLEKVQEFQAWARKIQPLLHLLDKAPTSELEQKICSEENEVGIKDFDFLMDDKLVEKCQTLYDELLAEELEGQKKIKELLENMMTALRKLQDKREIGLGYTSSDARFTKSIEGVMSTMLLMDKERSQRVQVFIGELRKEISDIWNKCMITDEEKSKFEQFHSKEYSEDMLQIHKEELAKWQIYHTKNQEILTKIVKRDEMWVQLRDLEAKANDPNRFVNRGGTLLKDQNLHNAIMKNLPKLETELIKLAENFLREHGRTMKIRGKEIPAMVDEDWNLFKLEKAAKKNPRPVATPSTGVSASSGPISAPLRATRQSVRPTQIQLPGSSSSKAAEKRPGSRLTPGAFTPLSKRKFMSTDSVDSAL